LSHPPRKNAYLHQHPQINILTCIQRLATQSAQHLKKINLSLDKSNKPIKIKKQVTIWEYLHIVGTLERVYLWQE